MQHQSRQKGEFHRAVFFLLATAICLLIPPASVSADEITVEYSFTYPEITTVVIDNQAFDRIMIEGAPNSGMAGQPALPARGARVLIPYGAEVTDVRVIYEEKIFLGDGIFIEPVEEPFPISSDPSQRKPVAPDAAIYGSNDPFPGSLFKNIGVQTFRGYQILVLRLAPMEYLPASGELYYCPKMTVVITTAPSGKSLPLFRGLPSDEESVLKKIDNPDAVYSYGAISKADGGRNFDLLMIIDAVYAPYFQPLKDYHDTTGILTDMVTSDVIGGTDAHTLRDYIRQRYLDDGIEYVIIGGDDDLFPALDLYVEMLPEDTIYTAYDMPGDLYYGCLDGTYNFDGDTLWGEPTDGEGGGDVDLMAEVYVGRASISSAAEAYNFSMKSIAFMESDAAYLDKVLLLGEQLRFSGLGEYGGYSLDELVDYSTEHGYTTYGIPSAPYEIEKLYDLTFANNAWPNTEALSRINDGVQVVNHFGHCNPDWAFKMTSLQALAGMSSYNYCFIYSQGCKAGHFDNHDCWAEYATVMDDQGAFAAIMNARNGLGTAGSTDGPSQKFNREFWDAVFNPAEMMPEIGRANQDSKEDNIYRIDEMCMRYCTYELNLLGDPTIPLKTIGGLIFEYPSDVPAKVTAGQETTIEVEIFASGQGTLVPGSPQLHYQLNGGDEQTSALGETTRGTYEATLPAIECGDILEFYFSAEESTLGRIYNPGLGEPFTVFASLETISVFADDFETDLGWTSSGGLWARGIPTGVGGEEVDFGVPDPEEGTNGPNLYGYNLNGDYEKLMSAMYLTSPAINCTGYNNVHLSFQRWLNVEGPSHDYAGIEVSNNGTDWVTVWENPATTTDVLWTDCEYDISDIADGEASVHVRWIMGPTDYELSYSGWNIDDVEVLAYNCLSYVCGDANGSGSINILDVTFIVNYLYKGGSAPSPIEAGDPSGNGSINILDVTYIVNYLYKGGPSPICP